MISDQTAQAFNMLLNKLYTESYVFEGIGCAFTEAGHHGFAAFANNEAHERWRYGRKVKKYLQEFGKHVILSAISEAKTEYATPAEALTAMLSHDAAILKFIAGGTGNALKINENYAVKIMNKIYGKMLKEYNEVNEVNKKLQALAGDNWALVNMDSHLSDKYKHEEKEHY